MSAESYQLEVGETYAITTDLIPAPFGGIFLGYLFLDEDMVWFAFEVSPAKPVVKFFNPRFIRSLLPEKRPER